MFLNKVALLILCLAQFSVNAQAKDENPFFMYLAFNAPHDPRQAPKSYVEQYPLEEIAIPENYQPLYPNMGEEAVPKNRDERLAPFPRTEFAVKTHRQEYFASITHMDEQIGHILSALEKTGLAKNTIIIFTSDHGLAVGHHGLIGKQNMYEHSIHAPFIISGPDVPSNKTIHTPIYLQDAMATSLELAGCSTETIDFKSILPFLDGDNTTAKSVIYSAYLSTQRTIIEKEWKLIVYPKIRVYKLFNLNKDPYEMNDLATEEQYSTKLKEMTLLLETAMDKNEDPMRSLAEANYPIKKSKRHTIKK